MEKTLSIKQDVKFKRRKQVRNLSSINLDQHKGNLQKNKDKQHHLPIINSHQASFEKSEKCLNVSMKNPLFRNADDHYLKLNKMYEKKLDEKIRTIPKNNEVVLIQAHLEILKKIIKIDYFGSVLEKIHLKIASFFNQYTRQDTSFTETSQENEVNRLKEIIKELELSKKSVDQKLKKLSIENIDLLDKIDKLEEENLLLKDYKKNIKIIDGVPDTMPILKELRTKTTILDSLDKKNKDLSKKEKMFNILIRALKEKGMNARDLIHSFNDRRSSTDSMNLSRMSFCSEVSRLS